MKPISVKPMEEPTVANFHFKEKGKVQPIGYKGLGVDQEATIILKGKIKQLGVSSWQAGKGFSIEIASCEISTPDKSVTIDDAIKASASSGKRIT